MTVIAALLLAQATTAPAAAAPQAPAAAPQPAPAPLRNPAQADARCLAAFGMLASNPQPDVQRASQLGALYFYGKLLGRNPAIDLRAAMLDAAATIAPNVRAELTRCGGELQQAGQTMQAVGNAIAGTAAPGAAPTPVPSPSPTPRR